MSTQETWETHEVINWLINDEGAYLDTLGMSADEVEQYVVADHLAPAGLYESMESPPRSSWDDVDWDAVAEACAE